MKEKWESIPIQQGKKTETQRGGHTGVGRINYNHFYCLHVWTFFNRPGVFYIPMLTPPPPARGNIIAYSYISGWGLTSLEKFSLILSMQQTFDFCVHVKNLATHDGTENGGETLFSI